MKKQLFSLVMMLALVVLAGTSAWAQTGTALDPIIQVNGSAHTLHVDAHGTNTYAWVTSAVPADFSAYTDDDTRTLSYTWSETALGAFTFDVTETDLSAACKTTTRRIHVLVIDFDIFVYWSNAGVNIEADAAQMAACSEGTEANYGDDPAGASFGQEVNLGNTGAVDGDLSTQIGRAPMTEREITLEIHWNVGTSGFDPSSLTIGSIGFSYALNITNEQGTFESFNGIATATTGTTYVNGGGAEGATWSVPIEYNSQWGLDDVTTNVTVDACTLYSLADGPTAVGQSIVGVERDGNVAAAGTPATSQNTTDDQVIYSAPATTVIGVD